jgi:uncharacterized protein (TIGR03083 family)
VKIAEHIEALREQGDALADAASRAGLDAPVPPCAPWRVKDLLRHTGYVHRWAASHIVSPTGQVRDGPSEEEILRGGAPDDELVGWFRDGHAALVRALRAADPELETAAFMAAPSPLAFWARRQAHETAIHRADADSAAGDVPGYPAEFAADGVDELITGFGQRRKYRPETGRNGTLSVLATDTGDGWHVRMEDGRIRAAREPGVVVGSEAAAVMTELESAAMGAPADCVVSGPASAVYLFLWNRGGSAVTVSGDAAVLDQWKRGVRVRWD